MAHEVACICGKILLVSEDLAGASITCVCGRLVCTPGQSEAPAHAITNAVPPPVPELTLSPPSPPARPLAVAEIIAAMPVSLRIEQGSSRGVFEPVLAALTPDAVWFQHTWELRSVPLQGLGIERRRKGKELVLALGPAPSDEKLTLAFPSSGEAERWYREILQQQQQLPSDAPPTERRPAGGVALVRQAPKVSYVEVGRVEFTGQTYWEADRGAQLRAGLLGADAIVNVYRHKPPEGGWGVCHVSGVAVRVEDGNAHKRLRMVWYAEEVCSLVNRVLILLVIQGGLLFVLAVSGVHVSGLEAATGEKPSEALASVGAAMGIMYAWPLVLLVLLRGLRWLQFLRGAGVAVLAVTAGRGLTVWVGHFLAVGTTGVSLDKSHFWILLDPVDWAFVIWGAVLCARMWRLASDARKILPPEVQTCSAARRAWSGGLLATSAVYAVVLLGWIGTARYESSAHVLQPGIDGKREQEALLALNEGANQANNGDLKSAEQSLLRSLVLWEKLTAARSVPPVYRENLALTLYNLGWICHKQDRVDEAERYYARAVAEGDKLAGKPSRSPEFKDIMAGARTSLGDFRDRKANRLREEKGLKAAQILEEKDLKAAQKAEEGQVKADKGEAAAESLYEEAIALWEEILPQATNESYRRSTITRLASHYLMLGEFQQQVGKRAEAEANLRKAVSYGEKAVALEPDRPLVRHNLEVARRKLAGLREVALQEEIDRLWNAKRFADVHALCLKSIKEQEELVQQGKDRDAAVRRLAYRLHRFAWLLAHCPDPRIHDAKTAVAHARRATQLQPEIGVYRYTLAMVQYRNGDWRDSLASLEKVKALEGGFDGSGWLLLAMNRHQLKQRQESRDALRQAGEWIQEQQRKAENNPLLRLQYERNRPSLEVLQQEAETLIKGKNPRDDE